MLTNNKKEERSYSISATVFIYGVLATLLATIVLIVCLLLFSYYMVQQERKATIESVTTLKQLIEVKQQLTQCKIQTAAYKGRVHSFEATLFNSNRTAVEASVREFMKHSGGEDVSIKEFEKWLKFK